MAKWWIFWFGLIVVFFAGANISNIGILRGEWLITMIGTILVFFSVAAFGHSVGYLAAMKDSARPSRRKRAGRKS